MEASEHFFGSQTYSLNSQPNSMVQRIPWFFLVILLSGSVATRAQEERETCLISLAGEEVSCPISIQQRFHWVVKSAVGPESLTAGLFLAGIATGRDTPEEYGPHWDGFGKRYGMRLTGIATSNVLEGGFGSLWNEDPEVFSRHRSARERSNPKHSGDDIRGAAGRLGVWRRLTPDISVKPEATSFRTLGVQAVSPA